MNDEVPNVPQSIYVKPKPAPRPPAPPMQPYERVLILALDSVCWEVLLPLVADGTMPALGVYLKKANYGVLESTVPPHTAAAWTTFLTGMDPGRHGVIDFVGFDPVKHQFKFHDSTKNRAESLFMRLSSAGISCGSIFLPRNYPPYALQDGYIISGFETPGTSSDFTEPHALRKEVFSVSPKLHFNFEQDWEEVTDDAAFERNIDRAIESVKVLESLSLHFQRNNPTKLQVAYLQATDILFHKAWKWCVAASAENPPTQRKGCDDSRRRDLIKTFFRRIDQFINRALGLHSSSTSQRFRPGGPARTLRLIVSDHGHGSSKGRVFINNFLRDWGYLKPLSGFKSVSRRVTLLTLDAATRKARSREMALEWSQTKAYLAHVGIYGFVYLNLKGREANGIVKPEDFESVRNDLIKRFLAEKIPGTNDPLFIKVHKGEEIYTRKKELNLPDLIVVPADGFYPRKKITSGPGLRVSPDSVGGIHRTEGVFAFEGPGIVPSNGVGIRANIADITPTLLAALGQPLSRRMSGKPLLEIFTDPPNVEYAEDDGDAPPADPISVYSKEEQEEIEKRLQDLGYLE